MIAELTNKYSVTKTLRFALIPQGRTKEYFEQNILEEDFERAENYKTIKVVIDNYHKSFIESSLREVELSEKLKLCAELYYKLKKATSEDKEILNETLTTVRRDLRTEIVESFTKNPKEFKKLFGKELIEELLFSFVDTVEEKEALKSFYGFTTYFKNLHETRKNMYSREEQSTAIAYRIINENLPKFLDNVVVYEKVKMYLDISEISNQFGIEVEKLFSIEYFNSCMTQSGIARYNQILGGFTGSDKVKVQGINEMINLAAQKNKLKLPQMKMLFKQILSEKEKLSFIPEQFKTDEELLGTIKEFYISEKDGDSYKDILSNMATLIINIQEFDLGKIYVKGKGVLPQISKEVYGDWEIIPNAIRSEFDATTTKSKKDMEKYLDYRNKELLKISQYSIEKLKFYANDNSELLEQFLSRRIQELLQTINEKFEVVQPILEDHCKERPLISDDDRIRKIKQFLDALKDFQYFCGLFNCNSSDVEKDASFYGEYENLLQTIELLIPVYDKVRNYVTKKPYSVEKYKLNFQSATLLNGFDRNKESANLSIILRDEEKYYLGIMAKKHNKVFADFEHLEEGAFYEKMDYKLLPGPNKMLPKVFLSKKGVQAFKPSEEILEAYAKGTHKKGKDFSLSDCHRLIDYFKECIQNHEYQEFGFHFSDTKSYPDISYFYREVSEQSYKVRFNRVSKELVDQLVEEGKLYLFQIYNKDFSEYSKGTSNLHTMYFKALFDNKNLNEVVYKLNGEAEVFYRPASIKVDKITHPQGVKIKNKNPKNPKRESIFEYDLVKDKRYTKEQFLFHVPITMNFNAEGQSNINDTVRELIKGGQVQNIIGIDRGERHLLYVSVINEKGEIIEQYSLNTNKFSYADNNGNIVQSEVDYHRLLDEKEGERQKARKDWKSIQNIKELKKGYLSQVVHKICLLIEKYDAIVVMEDLNTGFKNSRIKVEKQVYQNFEKALIDKLNYYVNKKKLDEEAGGVYRAYQCTNRFVSFEKMGKQNGIIFYVPAWLTSKIDPVTGFVDLLKPKYQNKEQSKAFIEKLDGIKYNAEEKCFEFSVDYSKFQRTDAAYQKEWVICTHGDRIVNIRDKGSNGKYISKRVHLTKEWKSLFKENGIVYENGCMKAQILQQEKSEFFKGFMRLLKLTLQMRNSEINSEVDFLISPIKGEGGMYYNSDAAGTGAPDNADANGAYHIAKKGLWIIEQIKGADDVSKVKLAISNKEWLAYTQRKRG